jgi:hypothetical protein
MAIVMPSFDDVDGRADSLADLLFEERHGVSIAGRIDDDAVSQLRTGPWPRNGHTIAALVDKVSLLLELDGSIADGELLRSVSVHDISGALLDVIRDERREDALVEQTLPAIAVEGATDKLFLEAASTAHLGETGEDLMDGLEIVVCDGASKIPAVLVALAAERRSAVGLFDGDRIGVDHKKAVSKVGLKAVTIPLDLGPLHNSSYGDEIEIEDLLPAELLGLFYEEHRDLEPETYIRHRGRERIVPHMDDKYEFASWCAGRGSYTDFGKLLGLLRSLRAVLGLSSSGV